MLSNELLLPFHKRFPNKFRSETIFGQYEKIYRRPVLCKNKRSKECKQQEMEEELKLRKVLDFNRVQQFPNQIHCILNYCRKVNKNKSLHQKVYGVRQMPGLFMLPKYLSIEQQFKWIELLLKEYSASSYNNISNLLKTKKKEPMENGKPLQFNSNSLWMNALLTGNMDEFRCLTWCNLGIKYDWTQREYELHTVTDEIPMEMIELCNEMNVILNAEVFDIGGDQEIEMQIKAQTAIINYFEVNCKRPMGGHRDAAETVNAPLISVSLGNSAIFLIGYDDNLPPIPLWLKSGDILIMSGKARYALHCVARVVPNTISLPLLQFFDQKIEHEKENKNNKYSTVKELKMMKEYILQSRLNFNIRQVHRVVRKTISSAMNPTCTLYFHRMNCF